uniref:6-phosphogluconolactonase n=1 Tax=Esox lucius TaxID=8010 RepID=A0A3P8ZWG4_ESOLU
MSARRVVVFPSAAELGPTLAHLVASRADKALKDRGRFTVGLSGGSLVSMLSKELPALPDLDCSRWLAGFCDERLVPFDDGESTYGLYKSQLFSKINIPDSGVLAIDPSLTVHECAEDYANKLKKAFPNEDIPVFDVLLLGMGPDGHTCSLFPDHPLLEETQKIVAPINNSPKPPPQRVTMTFPVQVLEGGEGPTLPAARVVPSQGELFWLIDEPAAASLTVHVERQSTAAKL